MLYTRQAFSFCFYTYCNMVVLEIFLTHDFFLTELIKYLYIANWENKTYIVTRILLCLQWENQAKNLRQKRRKLIKKKARSMRKPEDIPLHLRAL